MALSAWKAVRSVATITGDEVLGGKLLLKFCLEGSTPVAMYHEPVLWRSAFQAHRPCRAFRALRARLSSLRSVVPSRHLTPNFTNTIYIYDCLHRRKAKSGAKHCAGARGR